MLEKICLGDTVHCYNKNIDIEVEVRCISYKWDCVNEEYIEIELGQFISSYVDMQNQIISDTNKKIDDTKDELKDDIADAKEETNNLKVVMEKRDSEIELSVTNEAENRTTAIEVLDGKIEERVTQGEFGTYKTQTEKEISQKVSAGTEFSSELKQNVSVFQFLFEGASDGKTEIGADGITVYEGGFKIKDNSDNTIMRIDSDGTIVCNTIGVDNLVLHDIEKGGSFYNSVANMEELYCDKYSCARLYIDGVHIYDYIVDVLKNKGLI